MRILGVLLLCLSPALAQNGAEVTIKGGLQCNGMCVPDPKKDDHVLVVFAVDGSPEITAKVKKTAGRPNTARRGSTRRRRRAGPVRR